MEAARKASVIAGRYLLLSEVASGGMASVHLARVAGPAGFAKVVAVKRLHEHLAREPEVVSMFLDEARLASRVRHANVVPILDVVSDGDANYIVMEYVLGESLAGLLRASREGVPVDLAAAIAVNMLEGLHAAHDARGDLGEPLGIVHRDVSPQNVIIGVDGIARVLDFGIAKAQGRSHTTRDGQVKGKAAYMPPEQLRAMPVDRRADVYSVGVVLWEMLTARRLFSADDPMAVMMRVVQDEPPPPSRFAKAVPPALDEIVLRALGKSADTRFPTARAMADAIERAVTVAPPRAVSRFRETVAGDRLAERARILERAEALAPTASGSFTLPRDGASNADSFQGTTSETTGIRRALKQRRARIFAGIGAAALVLVVAAFIGSSRTTDEGIAPATAIAPSAPSEAVTTATTVGASQGAPEVADLDTLALERAAAQTGSASSAGPRHGPRTTPSARPSCNPPWTLDSEGIKVLKPECR